MANLVLRHKAKLSKIKQMWHLHMVCSKFAIEVNPFFRPVAFPGSSLTRNVLLQSGGTDVEGIDQQDLAVELGLIFSCVTVTSLTRTKTEYTM